MGLIRIMERGGSDYHDYKKALKTAKKAIDTLCDITDDMEDEYGYKERRSEYDDIDEREVRKYKRRSM